MDIGIAAHALNYSGLLTEEENALQGAVWYLRVFPISFLFVQTLFPRIHFFHPPLTLCTILQLVEMCW